MKDLFDRRKEEDMKDEDIINLYWEREERAISATAEKYGNYCHVIAYNILHNNEDAEECANDTYLAAWNSIPPHRPHPLSAYLGRITRNLALNKYKRSNTKKRGFGQVPSVLSELEECIPSSSSVEQEAEENRLIELINDFLYTQPQIKRTVFVRRYWHLWAIRTIAEKYDMTESKVASILFRMRNELKEHLEKEGISL